MYKVFYLAIFLLPILSFQVVKGTNFVLSDIVFFLLLVITVFDGKFIKTKTSKIYYLLFFFYFLSSLLTLFKANLFSNALVGVLQHIFTFIGIFIVLNRFIVSKKVLENCLKALIFMGVVSVGFTLNFNAATVHGRHFSFMSSLSVYGLYLTSIIPFIFYFIFKNESKLKRTMALSSLVVVFYGIVLSGSRSGIIVTLIILALLSHYYFITRIKKNEIRFMVNFLFFSILSTAIWKFDLILSNLIAFIFPIQPNLASKLGSLYATNIGEIDMVRVENLLSFFDNLDKYRLIGVGFNNFHSTIGGISLHNFLLAIWAELGLIAFIAMVLLLVILLFKLAKYSNRIKNDNLFVTLLISNIGAIIFMSLNPLYSHRVTWFFFLLGYVVLIKYEKKELDI